METYYFVANEDGDKALDKDGYDYRKPESLRPFEFYDYAYKSEQAAQGHVNWNDPEGRAGLQVISREVELVIE